MKTAYLSSYSLHKLWELVYVFFFFFFFFFFAIKEILWVLGLLSNVFGVMSFDFFSTMIKSDNKNKRSVRR